ncbi:nitroreductase family protein [Janthinobacterium lividum]|nr:nitroreductase family protein [Janthinobacterium lividum]
MEFEENLLQAVDIARQAPSSHNCQPWKLVYIEDRRMRAQLCRHMLGRSTSSCCCWASIASVR